MQPTTPVDGQHFKPDGVISVEHQLEIHINDLVDVEKNPDISLNEVLAGLQYVLDYRIVGKIQRLERELMEKLARGLLIYMGVKKGKFLVQRLTDDASLAFFLFGQFFAQGQCICRMFDLT
jgi:Ca2+-transporting ATPase